MNQAWFEMADHRHRRLSAAVWIPLRAINRIERAGRNGHLGFKEEFFGAGSLAVSVEHKNAALNLGWDSLGISQNHAGCVQDGRYVPADISEAFRDQPPGLHLVLDQRSSDDDPNEWHLHQDVVTTLGLKRERDSWLRPEDGYLEVARLIRASDGSPCLLQFRASHLRDYLCARDMGLVVSSYRDRTAVFDNADFIQWTKKRLEETVATGRWCGTVSEIHEGGRAFGSETFVMHVSHKGLDPEEDVPVLPHPTEGRFESSSWTSKSSGKKLYRVSGELWMTDWIDPSQASPIVRGDKVGSSVAFIVDAEGKTTNADALVDAGRWLWFKSTVIPAIINRRGGHLEWHTRDTGSVACLRGYDVHFGVNSIGLVTVRLALDGS